MKNHMHLKTQEVIPDHLVQLLYDKECIQVKVFYARLLPIY